MSPSTRRNLTGVALVDGTFVVCCALWAVVTWWRERHLFD